MKLTSVLYASVVVLSGATAVQAEDSHHTQAAPEATGLDSGNMAMMAMMPEMTGMMQKMAMMQGMMDPTRHVEGRIAFLHAELAITPAQEPQWAVLAEALRQVSRETSAVAPADHGHEDGSVVVGQLLAREHRLQTQLDGLRAVNAALTPLADALTEDQRGTLDAIFPQVSGLMEMGGVMPVLDMPDMAPPAP